MFIKNKIILNLSLAKNDKLIFYFNIVLGNNFLTTNKDLFLPIYLTISGFNAKNEVFFIYSV